jgi:EmrB/QacA subfamily drug resistance transporter
MSPTSWSAQQWVALLGLSFAVFMVSLDVTLVVVSLPRIQADFGLSLSSLQWIVSAYSLTFACTLLSAGVLADRFGRRRSFFIGMFLFAGASAAAGLSDIAWLLNLSRAIQGVGAAILLSSSGGLLAQSFSGADRAKAFGVWGAVVGIGLAFGPLIGGMITTHVGWHWIFLINVPVAVFILLAIAKSLPSDTSTLDRPLDWIGLVTFSGGLFALVYALSAMHPGGTEYGYTLWIVAAGTLLLVAFFSSQRLQRWPMIDLPLLRNRAFVGISLMPVLLSTAYWSLLVFLPQYLNESRGLDALGTGLAVLPLTLPMLLLPPLAARLSLYVERHVHFAFAFAFIALGALTMFVSLHVHSGLLAVGMALSGIGTGLINAQLTNVAVSLVPQERAGMATGVTGTMRQAGFVFAIAIHTLLIEHGKSVSSTAGEGLQIGFGYVLISAVAASLIAILIALTWLRTSSRRIK